jgi:histidinol-phosphate/aromatic aminotransferase/cobyric acid decarboxylase-like protein
VLFGRFAERRVVWRDLLDRGVLVREVGPPDWLRVSVGTPQEMTAFRMALAGVLAERPPNPTVPNPTVPNPTAKEVTR